MSFALFESTMEIHNALKTEIVQTGAKHMILKPKMNILIETLALSAEMIFIFSGANCGITLLNMIGLIIVFNIDKMTI